MNKMNDEKFRQLVHDTADKCLAGIDARPSLEHRIMYQIEHQDSGHVKKKISMVMVFAIVAMLALAGTAVAVGLGLFGKFAGTDPSGTRNSRLEQLDAIAASIGETVHVNAYPSGITAGNTVREALLTAWDGCAFDVTLNLAYCDGSRLYYSYTLTIEDLPSNVFGQGEASGFDTWSVDQYGDTYETSGIHSNEKSDEAARNFFAELEEENKSGYAAFTYFSIGDGAYIVDADGGLYPSMIVDSDDAWLDDRTIQGNQEVEIPTNIANNGFLNFTLDIHYGATVFYQNDEGLHWTSISTLPKREKLLAPFTVEIDTFVDRKMGTGELGGYYTEASLTFTNADVYGKVIIAGPESWIAAKEESSHEDVIVGFELIADGQTLMPLEMAIIFLDDGRYEIPLRFNLPSSRENLVLIPIYQETGVHEEESIRLN